LGDESTAAESLLAVHPDEEDAPPSHRGPFALDLGVRSSLDAIQAAMCARSLTSSLFRKLRTPDAWVSRYVLAVAC
jgi:hypothetical protein